MVLVGGAAVDESDDLPFMLQHEETVAERIDPSRKFLLRGRLGCRKAAGLHAGHRLHVLRAHGADVDL